MTPEVWAVFTECQNNQPNVYKALFEQRERRHREGQKETDRNRDKDKEKEKRRKNRRETDLGEKETETTCIDSHMGTASPA